MALEWDNSKTCVESHFSRGIEVLTISHFDFECDGVPFRIIGTRAEVGDYVCTIKNMRNGKISEMDHQKLARVIRADIQQREEAAAQIKAAEETKRQAQLARLPTVEPQKGLF